MKVLIIIPYFGLKPKWFDFFIHGCKSNPSFHWLLFTDFEEPKKLPENVILEKSTLTKFNQLVAQKLGLNVRINNPYKICDFRPTFGILFEDYLDTYDFWGYSDIDLVYGRLDHFITRNMLHSYDIITTREGYLAGHFTLFRNTDFINHLFKRSPNHSKILKRDTLHFAFDERSNFFGRRLFVPTTHHFLISIYSIIEKIVHKLLFKLNKPKAEDMSSIVESLKSQGTIKLFQKDLVKSDLWYEKNNRGTWKIIWDRGILKDAENNLELLYFHFIHSKNKTYFQVDPYLKTTRFSVTSQGIRNHALKE